MKPLVVINADDLGRSPEVNAAVFQAFDRGWITSATVMTNMPFFGDALSTLAERHLDRRIGLHLNLTEGRPLTDGILRCRAFCGPDGLFRGERPARWRLDAIERQAVHAELEAQVATLLRMGVRPSHLDSHHHIHTQWPISTIVIRLAQQFGVQAVRISRNCGELPPPLVRMYKAAFNRRLARLGLAAVAHFGSDPETWALRRFRGPVEVMVHPVSDPGGRVIDRMTGAQSLPEIASRWRDRGVLVSYDELLRATRTRPRP